jgi:hypothetical protein
LPGGSLDEPHYGIGHTLRLRRRRRREELRKVAMNLPQMVASAALIGLRSAAVGRSLQVSPAPRVRVGSDEERRRHQDAALPAASLNGFIVIENHSLDRLFPLENVDHTSYPTLRRRHAAASSGDWWVFTGNAT